MEAPTSPRMAVISVAALRGLGWRLALTAELLTLALAVLFAARRLAGGWGDELNAAELLLLTAALTGGAWGLRRIPRPSPPRGERRFDRLLHALPSAAATLLAAAVSSSDSPLWAVIALWVALAVEETWFWRGVFPLRHSSPTRRQSAVRVAEREARPVALQAEPNETPSAEDALEEVFSPRHRQQITRLRNEQGGETIYGRLRGEPAPGQRVHHLHVAFCPPLAAVPELAFEQVEGPDATLTAGQIESYGARIEVRLARPAAEGESVVVEFFAHSST